MSLLELLLGREFVNSSEPSNAVGFFFALDFCKKEDKTAALCFTRGKVLSPGFLSQSVV